MAFQTATVAVLFASTFAAVLPPADAFPRQSVLHTLGPSIRETTLPLILWHGLGDAFDSEGIKSVGNLYQNLFPGSFVYNVHLGDTGDADRHASFFGNLTEQVSSVCEDIRNTKELANAKTANAIGFSQGGVFLRGLVERCDAVNIKSLVTFGSPHSGIAQFTECADHDWWCKIWSGTLRGNTWGSFAQSTLVPAQYFRDPEDLDNFLASSNFLADINNERKEKNSIYKERIAALDRFVMYKFQDEEVIHPAEGSWFADSNATSGLLTRLKDREMYKQEWLGLKKLDEKGGIIFRTTPGKHMQIEEDALKDAFKRYFDMEGSDAENDVYTAGLGEEVSSPGQQIIPGRNKPNLLAGYLRATEPDQAPASSLIWPQQSQLLRHYVEEMAHTFA